MPTDLENPTQPVGEQLLRAVRRWWWLLVGCLVLGAGAAFAAAEVSTKQYASTASLLFQQDDLSGQLFGYSATVEVDPATLQATDLALVTQPTVARATAAALRVPETTVSSDISAAEAGATDVVNLTATTPSPTLSQRLVNEYAKQFIAYRESADQAQVLQAISELKGQVAQLKATGAPQIQIANLNTRLEQLDVLSAIQTGDVQLAASGGLPTTPSSPQKKRDIGLGLILGFLVGALAIALAQRFDQRIRGVEELAQFRLPIVGTIGHLKLLPRAGVQLTPQVFAEAESFRRLRVQLRYYNVDNPIRSVVITSAQPGDGKSTVAWHLAREAAVMNPDASVLLIDADLRKPSVARIARIPAEPGLTELLSSYMTPDQASHSIRLAGPPGTAPSLTIISAGGMAPNPYELLASNRMKHLLRELEAQYDLVVIDAPPSSAATEVIPLMREVSGVLVVVRGGQTSRRLLSPVLSQLQQVQVRVLGLVLNDMRARDGVYGTYYGESPRNSQEVAAVEEVAT